MSRKIICRYCNKPFTRSPYHPKQQVCHCAECQRRRKREYHRKKMADDADYRQTCTDSRKKWRENNPDYQRQYRQDHEAGNERNRQRQRERNVKRRLSVIVKNNFAIDVTRSFTEVWTIGSDLGEIVKNNLANSQVVIIQTDTPFRVQRAA